MVGKGKSECILRIEKNSVSICTDVLSKIFKKVGKRKFALYSINGTMRTGKSFILNKMLSYLNALEMNQTKNWFHNSKLEEKNFHWRGGCVRDTTGIDMWSEPFIRKINGEEIAILLIDTQGCFDDQTTMQENSMVFALSALFSSVLIYNVMKNITEDVLQFLHLFTGYANLASIDDKSRDYVDEDGFQKLVFLVRDMGMPDYSFGYYDENTCPSEQDCRKILNISLIQTIHIPQKYVLFDNKSSRRTKILAYLHYLTQGKTLNGKIVKKTWMRILKTM